MTRILSGALREVQELTELEFATFLSMVCEDSCLYSTFVIFTISIRAYRQRRRK